MCENFIKHISFQAGGQLIYIHKNPLCSFVTERGGEYKINLTFQEYILRKIFVYDNLENLENLLFFLFNTLWYDGMQLSYLVYSYLLRQINILIFPLYDHVKHGGSAWNSYCCKCTKHILEDIVFF